LKYSIIIPAWNEEAYLPATLKAVHEMMNVVRARLGFAGELIVVDNNSNDLTADIARAAGAIVVEEPVNQISRARNRGADRATGEILVFMDADTQCSSALLVHAISLIESGATVAGGSTIKSDIPIPKMAEYIVRFWNWLSISLKVAAGCFIFCRRDAFEEIKGFSQRVYAGEEIFLSRQLKRWAKNKQLAFEIVSTYPVTTSSRKLAWYGPLSLLKQAILMFIPGAVFSKRLCGTWYDEKAARR